MNILVIHEVDSLKKVTCEIHHISELCSRYDYAYTTNVPYLGIISFNETRYFVIPSILISIDSLVIRLMLLLMSVFLFNDRILRRGM